MSNCSGCLGSQTRESLQNPVYLEIPRSFRLAPTLAFKTAEFSSAGPLTYWLLMLMTQPSQFVQCAPFVQRTARFLALIPDTCVFCHLQSKHSLGMNPRIGRPPMRSLPSCRDAECQPCSHCALPTPRTNNLSAAVASHLWPITHWPGAASALRRTSGQATKFHQGEREAQALCSLCLQGASELSNRESLPDYLVPVPIASRTMLSRGFNQADWLASLWENGLVFRFLRKFQTRTALATQPRRAARMQLPAQTFTARRFEHLKNN